MGTSTRRGDGRSVCGGHLCQFRDRDADHDRVHRRYLARHFIQFGEWGWGHDGGMGGSLLDGLHTPQPGPCQRLQVSD